MTSQRFPTYFLSHGGGPWPWVPAMRTQFAETERQFAQLPSALPGRPQAVLMISAHWETSGFMVSTAARPPMVYDYGGFPESTYHIVYPAPGAPSLAVRVGAMLAGAGIDCGEDAQRGFDHGAFVPLALMYPQADIPVLMLSIRRDYDVQAHVRLGQALAPLRDEGVLIVGSGLNYHNMRGFGQPGVMAQSEAFEAYLADAVADPDPARRIDKLVHWERAPHARQVHPREDHLIPLLVAAGAAGADPGQRLYLDRVMGVAMASYRFG